MRCKRCGTELKKGQVFCPNCGLEIRVNDDIDLEDEYLNSVLREEHSELVEITDATADKGQNHHDVSNAERGPELLLQEQRKNAGSTESNNSGRGMEGTSNGSHSNGSGSNGGGPNGGGPYDRDPYGDGMTRARKRGLILLVIILAGTMACLLGWFHYRNLNNMSFLLQHARECYSNHEYSETISYAKRALQLDEENESALILLGKTQMELKEYKDAEATLKQAIGYYPDHLRGYRALLKLYQKWGKYNRILNLRDTVEDDGKIADLIDRYLTDQPDVSVDSGSYTDPQNVTLSCDDPLADIYYSTDGTKPTKKSTLYVPGRNNSIEISKEGTTVLQAVAYAKDGKRSRITRVVYKIHYKVPNKPTVTPAGGTFDYQTKITITADAGCTIYYVWKDADPTQKSKRYTKPLTVKTGNHVLSVIAVSQYGKKSDVVKYNFIYYPSKNSEESKDSSAESETVTGSSGTSENTNSSNSKQSSKKSKKDTGNNNEQNQNVTTGTAKKGRTNA